MKGGGERLISDDKAKWQPNDSPVENPDNNHCDNPDDFPDDFPDDYPGDNPDDNPEENPQFVFAINFNRSEIQYLINRFRRL
jgi:hypothetical protein